MTLLAPDGFVAVVVYLLALCAATIAILSRQRRLQALGFVPSWPVWSLTALAAGLLLVAVSAVQPAVATVGKRPARTDAQVWVVIDTSNSMLASSGPGAPTRLAQAKRFASQVQQQLADVPTGVAIMTNRILPLLPPTVDRSIFSTVVNQTVKPNTPPPVGWYLTANATGFNVLNNLADLNFYGAAKQKLAIVVSDMESDEFSASWVAQRLKSAHVKLLLVRAGSAGDKIYLKGTKADSAYKPQLEYLSQATKLAALFGHQMLPASAVGRTVAAARQDLGSGPVSNSGNQHELLSLSPYLLLAALPLLVFALSDLLIPAFVSRRDGGFTIFLGQVKNLSRRRQGA